ncbi:unnamed protein product, partial [Effrenium voratum]
QVALLEVRAAVPQPLELPEKTSHGSRGHPELCRRPCLHFAKRNCPHGEECKYCHLSHSTRQCGLDKRSRLLLKSLPAGQLLALLLPPLRARMSKLPHQEEAAGFLQAMEQEADGWCEEGHQKLQKRMEVMTFASLIGLISYASDVSGGLAQMAQDLLETLRAASQLAPNAVSEI